ncbi:RDD family protein [Streptomyces sp. NBC_01089]|uniref:RDD family protein n=1 Tax=Streptomyces sp. NBC_01089 TaxID=2903747 RepID=UPI0038673570|nr:RDD family protein [Streptomyces sp. NBC_01089]
MSAPTPATGDGSPTPGYYPDPSIPGYVRYWNGAAWVPGTSRPAPADDDQAMPVPPGGTAPAPAAPLPAVRRPSDASPVPRAEETGPVFFDEEPQEGPEYDSRQEPASVWQADASRQGGFGGERDRRVSWGGPDPRTPAEAPAPPADSAPPTPGRPVPAPRRAELPAGPESSRPALPTGRQAPPPDNTVTLRALGAGSGPGAGTGSGPGTARTSRTDGTMSIRAVRPQSQQSPQPQPSPAQQQQATPRQAAPQQQPVQPQPAVPQPAQPQSVQPQPQPQFQPPAAQVPPQPYPPEAAAPPAQAPSWPQQVQQLARAGEGADQERLPPWKPPVEDPFQAAARAQAAARPASLGKRFAARLIDTVVLGAVAGAVAVPFLTKAADHISGKIDEAKLSGTTVTVWLLDGTTAGYLGAAIGAFLVLGLLYEALPTAKWGRTLGKKLCQVQVRDMESYEPPSFGGAVTRWLLYGVLGLLVVGIVNVLWCLFDRPWRQCLHDKAARTFVAAG